MGIYEVDRKSKYFFLILLATASLIGWVFLTYYRPMIIESACSDIASQSSNLYFNSRSKFDTFYSYENIKARCLEEANNPRETTY